MHFFVFTFIAAGGFNTGVCMKVYVTKVKLKKEMLEITEQWIVQYLQPKATKDNNSNDLFILIVSFITQYTTTSWFFVQF